MQPKSNIDGLVLVMVTLRGGIPKTGAKNVPTIAINNPRIINRLPPVASVCLLKSILYNRYPGEVN
jgi:hypothetical protein